MTTISRLQLAFLLVWMVVFFLFIYSQVSPFFGTVIVIFGSTFGVALVAWWEKKRSRP
jgi:hypothetical protein